MLAEYDTEPLFCSISFVAPSMTKKRLRMQKSSTSVLAKIYAGRMKEKGINFFKYEEAKKARPMWQG